MLITRRNVCQYLIAKGLVSSDSVVDGDFAAIDVSGRNRNFKILRGRWAGYFVKQIQHWDAQTVAMLQCEAACYWLATNDAAFTSLQDVVPEFCWFDSDRHLLITGLIREGENLYEHFRVAGEFSSDVSAKLGAAIGSCHRVSAERLKESPHEGIFPRQTPWILSADRRNSHPFSELSRATSELFDLVVQAPYLREALDELGADWRAETLIHGDMRFENCILFRRGGQTELKLVDWELADIGDPGWDVGSIMQAYLAPTIMSSALDPGFNSGTKLISAAAIQNGAQEAARSLWTSYLSAREIETNDSSGLLERSVRYAAARMIQSAYEYVQFSPQVSQQAFSLVRASEEILRNTREVALLLTKLGSGSTSN